VGSGGGQRLARGDRQAQLVVICSPGQLRPTQVGLLVLSRQGQQQGRTLGADGQAQGARRQESERLVLPHDRLVGFEMMGILRLDVSGVSPLLPPECGGDVGRQFLTQRLHALAVERILPTFGRLLQLAR